MKKKTKIILTVLAAVIILSGTVVYQQWNNISALMYALNNTQEETQKDIEKNKEELENFLSGERI